MFFSGPITPTFTAEVTKSLTSVLTWVGSVVTELLSGKLAGLLPLFAIGISVSVLLLGVKAIKSFAWGS